MQGNMVVEALRYMLAEVEEKLTSVEEENARLKEVDMEYRRLLAALRQIERMSRDTFESYPGNTYSTGEAWRMAQVRTMGNIASTALVETKEVEE